MTNSVKEKSLAAQVGDSYLCGGCLVRLRVLYSAGLQYQGFQAFAAVALVLDLEHDCIDKDPVQGAQWSVVPLWMSNGTAQIEKFYRLG